MGHATQQTVLGGVALIVSTRRQNRGATSRVGQTAVSVPAVPSLDIQTGIGRYPQRVRPADSPKLFTDPPSSGHSSERKYVLRSADILMNRYAVRTRLGHGSFGTVVQAEDKITGTLVAVKIFHKEEDTSLAIDTKQEERMWLRVQGGCSPYSELFAAVLDTGEFRGHHCVVFELCHGTMHDVFEGYMGLAPLPTRHVIEIAYQLIRGVEYLHTIGIIHTDLKPDNIAFAHPATTEVQWLDVSTGYHSKTILVCPQITILDLGSAVDTSPGRKHFGRIAAQSYRAPEVILGLPWSHWVDLYATGCLIAELWLSRPLFLGNSVCDREHLAVVDRVISPFPEKYAREVNERIPGTFVITDKVTVEYPVGGIPLSRDEHGPPLQRISAAAPVSTRIHDISLCDLVSRLMSPDPEARLALHWAAKHKFFDPLARLQLR
ncbi:kinase-like protein [Trametes cingulata]|nr:kinase-like protein [Trametes cingulata]